jgi:hypothetical protein
MLIPQKGLRLCTDHGCFDQLDIENRTRRISEILASGEEGVDERNEIHNTTDIGDLEF